MKISAIARQTRNPDRVNVSVDGKYMFSLDVFQVTELGLKIGHEYNEQEIRKLQSESDFGKLYSRALEYCLLRPHSVKEIRDYLYRKTLTRCGRDGKTFQGVSKDLSIKVFERLVDRKYVDDEKFARFWVDNRMQKRGISHRKLVSELILKGVDKRIIDSIFNDTDRSDSTEIIKIINKKRSKYPDDQKMIAYLARLGFNYDDIREALTNNNQAVLSD